MKRKRVKRKQKVKSVIAWAGVSDGKIHGWMHMVQPYYELYRKRSDARKNYEQVVRVKIVPAAH